MGNPLPLFQAIEQHDVRRLVEALSSGVDPNAPHPEQPPWAPLKAAIEELAEGGPLDAVVLLLRHGAAVNGSGAPGDATPLLVAVLNRQLEAARILLAAGADPNLADDEGDAPLRSAVEQGDLAMAKLLLRCGARQTVHSRGGPGGMSALGRAVWNLDVPMVKLMLDAGADPEALDRDYRTAKDCLPPRETVDPQLWGEVAALLGH